MNSAHGTGSPVAGSARPGRLRRWLATVADTLSPTLRCDLCHVETKRSRYRASGAMRTIDVHASPWTPWAVTERELICPHCGGSVWEILGGYRSGMTFM